ncbi:hypothetical protein M9194_01045 [Vibrio sp. S4M6]|uniref:hypothetical protein n=1 Tax=Vibrio sinus TaxID=2946865 RepID=UPI00202A559E|nr:hypothetical protein [Vibrio sinus]MCL9780015.1 hypothetical protein [Vibrio sinus]
MKFKVLSLLVCSLLSTYALADAPILKNDPKRPVKQISHDLGVTEQQFVDCFRHVNPTPGGHRPESSARVLENKKVLLSCLKQANPSITNDSLDKVMDKYRPGGRKAQQPLS